jgi:hypothetical protein
MTKFVLNGYELESKKSEAKAKVTSALGWSVSISGNTIEVRYDSDASKVAAILSQVGVKYSGG